MEPLPQFDGASPAKLTPSMASFKVHVLAFITGFLNHHRISPTQGEIANGLGTTRTQVRNSIRALAKDGLLLRGPGERGLALPSQKDAAVALLLRLGWTVHDGVLAAPPPGTGQISPLPAAIELDYP